MKSVFAARGLPSLRPVRRARLQRSNAGSFALPQVSRVLTHKRWTAFRQGRGPVAQATRSSCNPTLPARSKREVPKWTSTERERAKEAKDAKPPSGSVLGAIALITGSTVGAGMLALPAATVGGGFVPSSGIMAVTSGFLILEALLIAEVNLALMKQRQAQGESPDMVVSLRQMAAETLGPWGGKVSSYVYLFLAYTLLVAYIAKGGEIVNLLSMETIPASVGGTLFSLLMGGLMFGGNTKTMDILNRVLTGGLLALFGVLVSGGGSIANWDSLLHHQDWGQAWGALPVVFLSLVFHDLIPVLCSYLGGDKMRVRTALVVGGIVPLIMFLAWDAVALALVPGAQEVVAAGGMIDPLRVLIESNGPSAGLVIEVFSLLAIVTSFIGCMLGLSEYLRSEIKELAQRKGEEGKGEEGVNDSGVEGLLGEKGCKLAAISLALVPPTLAAFINPDLFYIATQVAGGYGMTLLYGIIPPLMAWNLRSAPGAQHKPALKLPLVPGGRPLLASVASCAAALEFGKLAVDSSGLVNGLTAVSSKIGFVTNLVVGDLAAIEASLFHW